MMSTTNTERRSARRRFSGAGRPFHVLVAAIVAMLVAAVIGAPSQASATDRSDEVTLVVLGDSIGFGQYDWFGGGYARRYARMLSDDCNDQDYDVRVINLSIPGFRIDDLDRLLERPLVQDTVESADGILFEIGGNDLNDIRDAYRDNNDFDVAGAVDQVINEWNAVVDTIMDLLADGVPVLTFTLYYPYVNEDSPEDLAVLLGDKESPGALREYNTAVTDKDGVMVADVFTAFNIDWRGRTVDPEGFPKWYLAFDDFHPNYRGHSRIAQELCDLHVVY